MKFKILMCIMCITFVFFFGIYNTVYAASNNSTPSLVNKVNSAFTKTETYLKKIATPIAGVCIMSGIIIRKLSLGDERKLRMGKTVIINAIVGYAGIQLVDLILSFIEAVVK